MAGLGDWFKWTKLTEKPATQMIPPETIGVVLDERDMVRPAIIEGIPMTEEEIDALTEMVPESEISVIIENRDILSGDWVHVVSSNVEAIKYNIADATCDVEYISGRFYRY